MLLEFTVENFRSFQKKTTISLIASSDQSLANNTSTCEALKEDRAVNSAVLYGANASGKSNLNLAMALLRNFVLQSHTIQKGNKLNYQPFAFDPESKKSPTTFEVVFVHKEIKYRYALSYNAERIEREELVHYPNGRPALIFSRNGQDFEFKKDQTEQKVISKRTLESGLYISSSVQFNYEGTANAYDWFLNNFAILETSDIRSLIEYAVESMNQNRKAKEEILKALHIADLGIVGVEGRIRQVPIHELQGRIPPQVLGAWMLMSGGEAKETEIKFKHQVKKKNGSSEEISLPIEMESEGTRRLFAIIYPIIEALHSGGTIAIDELDTKLHHEISAWIIDLFHDPVQNPKGAQLIFNTHDQQLLSLIHI